MSYMKQKRNKAIKLKKFIGPTKEKHILFCLGKSGDTSFYLDGFDESIKEE